MRVFRPGPTGGGRPAPHPYAAGGTESNGDAEANGGPQPEPLTFVWRMPIPRGNPPDATVVRTNPDPQEGSQTDRPQTPTLVFNVPLHASPLPMDRSPGSHEQEPRGEVSDGQPDPAPQQNYSLREAPLPQPQQPSEALQQTPEAPEVQGMPDSQQVPVTQQAAAQPEDVVVDQPAASVENGAEGSHGERSSSTAIPPIAQPDVPDQAEAPQSAGQEGPAPDRLQPERRAHMHAHPAPHFHFFLNVPNPEPTPPSKPFIPQPLESWVEQREKALGWRCDAIECLVFNDHDGDRSSLEATEMLSIQVAEAGAEGCEHRWHRTCLEAAERGAGRARAVEGGKVRVRCQRCEKDGWVPEVEPSLSEGESCEVERMFT